MKIAYLGAGTWGFALATLLARKGHQVMLWTNRSDLKKYITEKREHPKLPGYSFEGDLRVTLDMAEALDHAECIAEAVTSAGIRPVFTQVSQIQKPQCPIVLTSKGIEQKTSLFLPEVVLDVLGEELQPFVACLSGPSHAEEVIRSLPSSVVCAAYDPSVRNAVCSLFSTESFRVYPNSDLRGVALGGALKNVIAIACGISDGLGFGDNTKAALMTRGLHEIHKLAQTLDCETSTLMGLSGMGDLAVTCWSEHGRNYRFGKLLAKYGDAKKAKEEIGMAIEGIYCCVSAHELAQVKQVPMPITENVYKILYKGIDAKDAVVALMQREVKEEHL
ncbi:MAG: glycerol-3-phosphate dehydrogenase [Waddliaceae bacterium]|nr:glycerol-3-phosphate dehydrogenase [Waddliaceae bacterium]